MDKMIELILGNTALQWTVLFVLIIIIAIFLTLFIQYNIDRAKGRHAKFFWVEVNATKDSPSALPEPLKTAPNINGKNINTGTNHGNIGDQYNGIKQRNITQQDVDFLSAEIDRFSRENTGKINKSHITLGYPMCKETTHLANQIHPILQKMGFSKISPACLQTYGTTGRKLGVSYAPDNSLMIEIFPPDNVD